MNELIIKTPVTPLTAKPLTLEGGSHGVLLFHGLSSSPLELQFVARGLQRAGYTVHAPVIPGYTYGLSPTQGDKHSTKHSAESWISAALKELDWLAEKCKTVSVGGLCIGAVLALRVAALRSARLHSVLALSTALHFNGWGNPWFTPLLNLARYLPFAPRILIREAEPYGLKDERMRAWVKRQMETAGQSNAGAASLQVRDLLLSRDLIALARQSLPQIKCAALLIHAKEDEIASTKSSYEVADRISASRIHLVVLSNSYHMISIDQEKDLVIFEIVQFLAQSKVIPRISLQIQKPSTADKTALSSSLLPDASQYG